MKLTDLGHILEKTLGLHYLEVKWPQIEAYYRTRSKIITAMNDLMEKGDKSETYKYWDSQQSIVNRINMGRR